jgi:hypothetical protein
VVNYQPSKLEIWVRFPLSAIWGNNSVGRVYVLHAFGQGFESPLLHNLINKIMNNKNQHNIFLSVRAKAKQFFYYLGSFGIYSAIGIYILVTIIFFFGYRQTIKVAVERDRKFKEALKAIKEEESELKTNSNVKEEESELKTNSDINSKQAKIKLLDTNINKEDKLK